MPHILTSHVGSLPRPPSLVELLRARHDGRPYDAARLDAEVRAAVDAVVARQVKLGVDVVSDGEMGKPSYATYVSERLTGFGGAEVKGHVAQDLADYRDLAVELVRMGLVVPTATGSACIGPVAPGDASVLQRELATFREAVDRHRPPHAFVAAASPGVIAVFQRNEHYPTHDAYLEALAEAMRPEYEAVHAAGFLLQLDSPDLGMNRHLGDRHLTDEQFLARAARQIEVLNHATRNIPPERMRIHLCWGNYVGPHHHDLPLELIWPLLVRARPATIALEAANPRHEHEWEVLRELGVPEDKRLMPGVVDTCSNYLEHPRLIAQRLERYAEIVGAERVIAGSDCGFSTFAGVSSVHPDIAWAKLGALVEGAALAERRLARRPARAPATASPSSVPPES